MSIADLARMLRGARVAVLTGAGVSTESGIPDYRSPERRDRPRKQVEGPAFVRSEKLRQRYWARAMMGWSAFSAAKPNLAHVALATLESRGVVSSLITQNVDRLHHAAGSRRVIELHGALAEVVCLACGAIFGRDDVQARMRRDNPTWRADDATIAPDGDADLADASAFVAPACASCGGALKPRVVFFGENVARPIVDEAFACVDAADALLVCGTSLAVFSGYRFLRHATQKNKSIAIVNRGPVRGEEHAAIKIDASTGITLRDLAAFD